MTPFGAKLRELRRRRKVTLSQMAAGIDVSPAYLSALEHGKRGRPTWFMVQRIITYFNVIWDEAEELQKLADCSDPKITIDTAGLDPRATEFANLLARHVGRLPGPSLDRLIAEVRKVAGEER